MEALECVFATGTVICNGPRRSTAAKSGARIACLIAAPEIGVDGFDDDTEVPEEDDGGEGGINPEFEDWSLVFTTSNGHVIIAPIVPPVLNFKKAN